MPSKRRSPTKIAAFWKTVADLAVDRRRALGELETAFRAGAVPEGLEGFHPGRLVASTVGYGLDVVAETLARLWMPWKGKTFDPSGGDGWNVFDARGRWVARLLWPRYDGHPRSLEYGPHAPRLETALRFVTSVGESALFADVNALRIAYDLEENPAWPVRRVLDELVEVDRDLFLGQALLHLRGRWRRAAWFSLEGPR